MYSSEKALQSIYAHLSEHHRVDDDYRLKITATYNYIQTLFSTIKEKDFYISHALSVADLIASWRLDISVVIAAMLHDVFIREFATIDTITGFVDESVITILEGFVDIQTQMKHFEESNVAEEILLEVFDNNCSESFYIKIAERLDILSDYIETQNQSALSVAQSTREILVPLVKQIKAYKLVDNLEELCFKVENAAAYKAILDTVHFQKETCGYGMQQFLSRMDQIFDPYSNIISNDLKKNQRFIKSFFYDNRSVISLHRFVTRTEGAGASWENDLEKIKNISRTALYDLTLVVDDSCVGEGITAIDIFLNYYEAILRPENVFLYGFYHTTNQDAGYFLLSDSMKNMYRFFIRYESSFLCYLYGNLAEDSYNIQYNDNQNQIKVFRKNGRAEFIKKGASVLDLAFIIHPDLGLHFSHAKLNNRTSSVPVYTVLNNGDTVEVIKDKKITAELNWFRYLKTEKAINDLIKYFKSKNTELGEEIKLITKDGSTATIPKGSTVLDYAFAIHEDIGLHCAYALINRNKKHYPIDHILRNGDQVIIVTEDDVWPDYFWFRHAKTEKSTNYLIEYFKKHTVSRWK